MGHVNATINIIRYVTTAFTKRGSCHLTANAVSYVTRIFPKRGLCQYNDKHHALRHHNIHKAWVHVTATRNIIRYVTTTFTKHGSCHSIYKHRALRHHNIRQAWLISVQLLSSLGHVVRGIEGWARKVQRIIPRLLFLSVRWRSAQTHQFLSFSRDQTTVAKRAEMTLDE